MTNGKNGNQIWLVSDKLTVHQDDQIIPPGTPFRGDAALIDRGIARAANADEIGGQDEG